MGAFCSVPLPQARPVLGGLPASFFATANAMSMCFNVQRSTAVREVLVVLWASLLPLQGGRGNKR
jgi:hypothetical protein